MIIKELLVTLGYLKTAGLACGIRVHNSKCLVLRVILFCLAVGLTIFDGYTHWKVWLTIRASGLDHPLLKVPSAWTRAWLVFTTIGTASALLYIINELSGVIGFYRAYKIKTDVCLPCMVVGFNYTTRVEILSLLNVSLEDFPLLVLSLLFAAAQYSCNHPTPSENRSILNVVFISSVASLLHVGWCVIRFLVYLLLRAVSQRRTARAKPGGKRPTIAQVIEAEAEEMKRKMKEMELEIKPDFIDYKLQNRQLYPSKYCRMKYCIICHSIALMVVCSLTIVISATAIALTKNQGVLTENLFLDPSRQLSVYRAYPEQQILVNASTIIHSERSPLCLREEFSQPTNGSNITTACDISLVYDPEEGQIHFNFGQVTHNVSNSSIAALESIEQCSQYYTGLFLGYYTEEGVRRFEETCLGVLILPNNDVLLQRKESLPLDCEDPLPMT